MRPGRFGGTGTGRSVATAFGGSVALAIAIGLLTVLFAVTRRPSSTPQRAERDGGLPTVTLDGRYFVRNGKRFVPVGAHWVPAKAGMEWPVRWDPADVEADFAKMRDLGFSIVRFDLVWAWFEPKPGVYNEEAFRQLDHLVELAHKYQVYLHPSLFIGGEVGEAYWDVPWRNGRNPHTDPEMLRLEAAHAGELAKRYADESAILAWDLTDEPPFWIVTGLGDREAAAWTRTIAGAIREHDTKHPIVVGTSGQETSRGPFRADNLPREVDFFSVHPFTIYRPELFPDAMLSVRSTYGAAFDIALSNGAGRPAMVHEMGASTAQYSPERIAQYERTNLYSALGAGTIGVDLWCFTDASAEQQKKLPYLRTPQESEWGLTTWDRLDKPRGRELRRFSRVVAQLNLEGDAIEADAGIVIPAEWANGELPPVDAAAPYVSTEDTVGSAAKRDTGNTWLMGAALSSFILSRRAGLKADFPREHGDWQKRPVVLLPSPLTSTSTPFLTHVHTDFYRRARSYVEGGGFLYASVAADAAIPDMEPLFGARLADTNTASEITLKVVKDYGRLKTGDIFRFTVARQQWGSILELGRGEVIAVDQDERPALVAHTLGKGSTLLCAYPIESYLAVTPSAFDHPPGLVDRLYSSIREASRGKPLLTSDDPDVEVTALNASTAVVVNHGPRTLTPRIFAHVPVHTVTRITPEGPRSLAVEGGQFRIDLDPWDGAVVTWR